MISLFIHRRRRRFRFRGGGGSDGVEIEKVEHHQKKGAAEKKTVRISARERISHKEILLS